VVCQRLKHRIPAHGYRVVEKDRTGHFDVKRAATLGIPPGPIYGKLKQGQVVTLDDGRKINGADLCGPTIVGRKLAYCTDTVFCENAIELAEQVDVLIHEATFSHQDAELAYQRMHSTSTMAAQVALAAQAKQLVMTHFSPRYAPGNAIGLEDLLAEAQAIFPNTVMAKDFFTVDIQRADTKEKVSKPKAAVGV
ncbi:MAG: MBL fold metallo-hydrolase, partial [Cyanobacteria bacterium J06632_3]